MNEPSQSLPEGVCDEMEEKIKVDELVNPAREHELGAVLQNLDGVRNVTMADRTVSIVYDPTAISAKAIQEKIQQAGFTPGKHEISATEPPVVEPPAPVSEQA